MENRYEIRSHAGKPLCQINITAWEGQGGVEFIDEPVFFKINNSLLEIIPAGKNIGIANE